MRSIRSLDTASPDTDHEPGWNHSLAFGAAGIILMHAELARTEQESRRLVQEWARIMCGLPVVAHPEAGGLYWGAVAVAYTLRAAERPEFGPVLASLDSHIDNIARKRLDQAHARIDQGSLPQLREFDLISGLTGVGAYLLMAKSPLTQYVLEYLVRLSEPIDTPDGTLPGWWSEQGPDGEVSGAWPGGHGNFGIAHGAAGPLAVLALAMRQGVMVTGQADAIRRIASWFDRWRQRSSTGRWWPAMISMRELDYGEIHQRGPQRPSWCYGTPGIARALQLAGLALSDHDLQKRAEEDLTDCITDEEQLRQLGDVALCHGWAGLVQASSRAAVDSAPRSALRRAVVEVEHRFESLCREGLPDGEGLLEGATGVRLVLATGRSGDQPSGWDRCLLLTA
jgi:lantibiotic biosynthesis protein